MMELTKFCKGCFKELPLYLYPNEPRNKDGKNGKCAHCVTEEAKARRNTIEYKEKMRLKRQDPKFKAKKALQDKAYRERVNINKSPKDPRPRISEEEHKKRKAISDKKYAENNKNRIAEYQKQYRLKNKDRLTSVRKEYINRIDFAEEEKARRRALREREPERIRADKRREYLENIERYRESARVYRDSDRGRAIAAEACARYRSKRDDASDGTVTEESLELLKKVQEFKCAYCLTDLTKLNKSKVHLDHICPISKGGLHSITNVVWSCATCNLRKNSAVSGWTVLTERI